MLKNYITNTIVPEGNDKIRFGKKMFSDNKSMCLKLGHSNAGVQGERIGELNMNSRKQIYLTKSDSSQMKNALSHSTDPYEEIYPSKKPMVSYSCYENQANHFETKLVPDTQGKMSIRVSRKSGSAAVNMNVEDYDLEKTYHTWKKIIDKSNPHTRSNLENDRFLTVAEDAQRSDRLPIVKNRNPPIANTDGPFESDRLDLPKQARGNLDRTLTPRVDQQNENSKKVAYTYKNTFPISQPHAYPHVEKIQQVKRNVSQWEHSDRAKKIIYNYEDDEDLDDMHGYDHYSNRKELKHPPCIKTNEHTQNKNNSSLNKPNFEQYYNQQHQCGQQHCELQNCEHTNESNEGVEHRYNITVNGSSNNTSRNGYTEPMNSYESRSNNGYYK